MFDFVLTDEQRALRDEVPCQLILDVDADEVRYPRRYVEKLAARPGARDVEADAKEADNVAEKVYE
jgi:hypothetical protein